ncbi:hypothetical protein NicSoilE8_43240 (plasmid) [Arthrobacter sp. NicSoilE8]|nr:hypothetical protein NicSoilE8_43240 [Arthrobacter sp. NicSoilE8]
MRKDAQAVRMTIAWDPSGIYASTAALASLRLAFGLEVTAFPVAGLYGQGHFYSRILGRQVIEDHA